MRVISSPRILIRIFSRYNKFSFVQFMIILFFFFQGHWWLRKEKNPVQIKDYGMTKKRLDHQVNQSRYFSSLLLFSHSLKSKAKKKKSQARRYIRLLKHCFSSIMKKLPWSFVAIQESLTPPDPGHSPLLFTTNSVKKKKGLRKENIHVSRGTGTR